MNFQQFTSFKLNQFGQVDFIYTKLSKAFGLVDNEILLAKLQKLNIHDTIIVIFQSYILGGRNFFQFGRHNSALFFPISSVTQGSNLEPSLFAIYFNDVETVFEKIISYLLYSDDIKIFLPILSTIECS